MPEHKTFPGGLRKALLMSFDDGCIQDRRLAAVFNRYGIRGTFHLNSGKLGRVESWNRIYSYVTPDEVKDLYAGHEVACHTVNHPYLTRLTPEEVRLEIEQDKTALESLCGRAVRGMSFPFHDYNDAVLALLPSFGIEYARTSWDSGRLDVPKDPYRWAFTCHFDRSGDFAGRFLADGSGDLAAFAVGGHSWELEAPGKWAAMEDFCAKIGGRDDVWYATMGEMADWVKKG